MSDYEDGSDTSVDGHDENECNGRNDDCHGDDGGDAGGDSAVLMVRVMGVTARARWRYLCSGVGCVDGASYFEDVGMTMAMTAMMMAMMSTAMTAMDGGTY